MGKPAFCLCKKRCRSASRMTAKLISAFVFATRIVNPSTSTIQNFKPLAIFCGCTARFVSDLVRNPKGRFSCDTAYISLTCCPYFFFLIKSTSAHKPQGQVSMVYQKTIVRNIMCRQLSTRADWRSG